MTAPFELASNARTAAEALMTSSCTIREKSPGTTTDPDTGAVTPTPGAQVYSGKCRVRPASAAGTTAQAGGALVFVYDYVVSIPFAVSSVTEGQRVTLDSSPDPALAGIEVEVQKVDRGDFVSARRLFCREVH